MLWLAIRGILNCGLWMIECRSRMVLCEPEVYFSRSMFNSHSRKIRKVSPDKGVRRTMLAIQGQSNSSTPCAACKLLRRRCAQECPFSPYFSPHEPQKFACVHKIYGASNVSKMLMVRPLRFSHPDQSLATCKRRLAMTGGGSAMSWHGYIYTREADFGVLGRIVFAGSPRESEGRCG